MIIRAIIHDLWYFSAAFLLLSLVTETIKFGFVSNHLNVGLLLLWTVGLGIVEALLNYE